MSKKTDCKETEMDDFFQKAYKENYGFWLTVGGLHPGKTRWNFIHLVFLVTTPVLMIPLLVTIFAVSDPLLSTECVHFLIFFTVEFIIVLSFNLERKNVQYVYRMIGMDFYDYGECLDAKTLKDVAILSVHSKKRKRILNKIVTWFVGGAYTSLTYLRPILKYIQQEHLVGSPDDGLHALLPVSVWLPFDKYGFWSNFIMYLLEWSLSSMSLGLVMGHSHFFLTSCEDIMVSIQALGLGMRRIKQRAKGLTGMEYEKALRVCMAHTVRHHQIIIRVLKSLEEVVYYTSLSLLVGSTILICMSGFLFFNDGVSVYAKGCFIFFLLAELFTDLIYCYYGEQIKTYSGNLHEEIYNSEWLEDSKVLRNYILIIQARTTEGLLINAGGYMFLNLETYGQVLSSAFSYFNIMNAIN